MRPSHICMQEGVVVVGLVGRCGGSGAERVVVGRVTHGHVAAFALRHVIFCNAPSMSKRITLLEKQGVFFPYLRKKT